MEEIVKVIKIEAPGSEQTVRQLRTEISSLRDALLNTVKGSDEYNKTLDKLVSAQKKLNDVMSAGKEAFQTKKQELAAIKNEMDKLVPGTKEYAAAFQRAADITHTLRERQEMLRYSSADLGTQMGNIVSIGKSMAGGFNAINAVISLTGDKSEDLQKAMVKLQAGIALVQGLQGLEGMSKRMKGLVAGLMEMVTHTGAAAAAVQAETTSIAANTTAQEANAAATTTATVATKAFSKALMATGIGAVIVLIGSLVAHWEDLKDMIGLSNEKLEQFNGILDKVRVVLGGVSNVIFNAFVASVKNAITAVSTLGEVTKNVLTFQFGKAAQAAKEGWGKIAENTKKGLSIVKNYQEGAAKTNAKLQDKRAREAAKASAEELNELIKDNEAKYGSDYKYTKEGKKLYDQYYTKKLQAYKKDSKEYKEAQREKWAYDREYAEHSKKTSETQSKQAKEATDKLLEEYEKIEKRAVDSQKTQLELLKDKYEEELVLYKQLGKDTTNLTKEYEANKTKIIEQEEQKRRQEAEKTRQAEEKEARRKAMEALRHSRNNLQNLSDANKTKTTSIELEYSFKEATQAGALTYNDIIAKTNAIYAANKEYLEAQAKEYKELMENVDADDETRLDAKRDYYNTLTQLDNLATQNIIDNVNLQREAVQQQIEMYSDMAEAIGDIFGSIADIMEEDIKTKIKNGKITEEEGEKQFKAVKAFQIAQATINTIAGAIAAFMSCQSTYPQPYGAIIGAVQAAAVTAAGVAQIAKIKNTQLNGSSNVSSVTAAAVQTEPEQYQPSFYANPTGESELVDLAKSIKDQRVILVESDVTEAQEKARRVRVESSW